MASSSRRARNDYDWFGEGIYFWEYGADRALRFAHDQKRRNKVQTPAVVGALVQLGRCFDLMDTRFTDELPLVFEMLKKLHEAQRRSLPNNAGKTPDKLLRHRDCALLNFYLSWLIQNRGDVYDTVRCGFVEGPPAFDGSGIRHRSHVQIAVRNPACVVDEDTRRRRRALAELQTLSIEELFQVAVRAGIYTQDGQLTAPYRDDGEPSGCRPTD